jgi:hypothetical protein
MGFCYYRNLVHEYVMIHRDECGFAQAGEGSHGITPGASEVGWWEGGFETYTDALMSAQEEVKGFTIGEGPAPDRAEILNCKHCGPGGGTRRERLAASQKRCERCMLTKGSGAFDPGSEVCRDCLY